jgi:hypothetical protein
LNLKAAEWPHAGHANVWCIKVGSSGIGPIVLIVIVPSQQGHGVVASVFDGVFMSLRLLRLHPPLSGYRFGSA